MGWIGWIVLGLIVGWVARRVTGYKNGGCLSTIVLGVLGAFIGGFLYNQVSNAKHVTDFNVGSMLVAVVGASLLCLLLRSIGRNGR